MTETKLPENFWTVEVPVDPFAQAPEVGADLALIEAHTAELESIVQQMWKDMTTETKILDGTEVPVYGSPAWALPPCEFPISYTMYSRMNASAPSYWHLDYTGIDPARVLTDERLLLTPSQWKTILDLGDTRGKDPLPPIEVTDSLRAKVFSENLSEWIRNAVSIGATAYDVLPRLRERYAVWRDAFQAELHRVPFVPGASEAKEKEERAAREALCQKRKEDILREHEASGLGLPPENELTSTQESPSTE
jgi:hypothetical protein